MSVFFSLIEFQRNDKSQISEEKSETLKRVELIDHLMDEILKKFSVIKTMVPEYYGSEDETQYNFLEEDEIDALYEFIDNKIIETILDNHDKEKIIVNLKNLKNELSILINITQLLDLKREYESELVKIKVGY